MNFGKFDNKKFEIDEVEEVIVKKQKPLIVTVTTYSVNENETDSDRLNPEKLNST